MTMNIRRQVCVGITWLALACAGPAQAQQVTTLEDLTLQQTLVGLVSPLASRPAAEAIATSAALEIGTAPLGSSSGGFVFKLDPATGLLVRTVSTFGPSFTDRAITSGEGQVSVNVNFRSTEYDKINEDLSLTGLRVGSISATSRAASRTGIADLTLTSKMLLVSGSVGVTDSFDVGVAVPVMSVKFSGASAFRSGEGVGVRLADGNGTFNGVGDIAALAKYRFLSFGNELPDPGGLAVTMRMRLPTGDPDNLVGLGITRTLGSVVFSGGNGRFRPHANAGYEYWNKGLDIPTDTVLNESVRVRHQVEYAAGVEVEATPKLTLLVDFLGQHILGAGKVGLVTEAAAPNAQGVTSFESLVALGDGYRKFTLVPGLKLNLKSKLLLTLNGLVTLETGGLHATFTPVVGLDLSM